MQEVNVASTFNVMYDIGYNTLYSFTVAYQLSTGLYKNRMDIVYRLEEKNKETVMTRIFQ